MPMKKGDPRAKRAAESRWKKKTRTAPQDQSDQVAADQVAQDRAVYDAKLTGGVPTTPEPEPEPVSAQPPTPPRDCALVPRPHDATGGCCWARVTGVELIEVKGTVRVLWRAVLIDGTPSPQQYKFSLDQWQALGGGVPVENPVLRSGFVAYRLRLSDGTLSETIVRQPVKEYAKLMNLPLPLPAHLTPLERPPLCPPSLVMPERTKADDVRDKAKAFDWKFPTAKDDDDLIEQYETCLATRTEREMAEAKRHANAIEHREERERLRKVGDFNRLMDSGA